MIAVSVNPKPFDEFELYLIHLIWYKEKFTADLSTNKTSRLAQLHWKHLLNCLN